MTIWRYTAVPLRDSGQVVRRKGELAGECAADVRAALRRIGLQVIELRAARASQTSERSVPSTWWHHAGGSIWTAVQRHIRRRRQHERAELYDGLATMLGSGVPLLEAVSTVASSCTRSRSSLRSMLVGIREQLRCGSSLAQAMQEHSSWFEASEVAMVEAGQHSGTLAEVLTSLAERHERTGELSQKLMNALAYPCIVAVVGLGVVAFLSVKTLPQLTRILVDAGVETPALTVAVMSFGQLLAHHWLAIGLGLLAIGFIALGAPGTAASLGIEWPRWLRRLSPKVVRRIAVARLSLQLADLLRSGVPMVESLRVLAPTASGSGNGLHRQLLAAADKVERGEEVSAAFDDEHWFDAQYRRLLEIGQTSGELDALLERVGHRYTRQATRLIDRLAALLEPCVILTLAVLVGLVVMAAVLPLLRLQEVL